MMHLRRSLLLLLIGLGALAIELPLRTSSAAGPATKKSVRTGDKPKSDTDTGKAKGAMKLRMSRAIVCRSIDGFEHYEPLGDVGLTSDEKLLVYYRPDGYKVAQRGQDRFVHFSQDGKIRRRGETRPVRSKLKLLDIESEGRNPPPEIYLRNTVSLKDLPPGDYEYDIVLRDVNAPGELATQTVSFRIVRAEAVGQEPTPTPEDATSK